MNFTYLLRYEEEMSELTLILRHVFHTLQHYIFCPEIIEVLALSPMPFCDQNAFTYCNLRQITATDCDDCINLRRSVIFVRLH
jgi:hypothetical protein